MRHILPPEPGDLTGKSVPVLTWVFVSHETEKFLVKLNTILLTAHCASTKAHVVRMRIQKGHAAFFSDPVKLLLPNPNIPLFKNYKKTVILGKGVGEFNVRVARVCRVTRVAWVT